MKPSAVKTVGACLSAIIGMFAAPARPATDSLVASMEVYFSALKDDFNQRAASSIVKTGRTAQLSGRNHEKEPSRRLAYEDRCKREGDLRARPK
jgi:hypothetical protein